MKNYLIALLILISSASASAKKVKFAVDVDTLFQAGLAVSPNGMHIYGNFQGAAGYPFDWDPGTTSLIQEPGDTTVYSIIVDIPAFQTYEYRYINGDQAYEVEFVPEESRVNGAFDDNRWIFLDSTANDTTFIGVMQLHKNAPEGLTLVRFKVNMRNENISPDRVHLAGSFQGWNPSATALGVVNDTSGIFEYEAYVVQGTYEYKFVNGITASGYEYVWGSCGVNGTRSVVVTNDIVLDAVNFGSCLVGVEENVLASNIKMFPNPSNGTSRIEFNDHQSFHAVMISDVAGRLVNRFNSNGNYQQIENLDAGIYLVSVKNNAEQESNLRLIVQ
ncbi:hypothetical protein BH11BAC1_BH11BAC1_08860 [soil metagenome]